MDNTWLLTLYKELHPVLWARHGGTAARLQESRAEAGVVTALRTEARRMPVRDDCARGAQRKAVWTEGPRDRDRLAACRVALSEWDFSD